MWSESVGAIFTYYKHDKLSLTVYCIMDIAVGKIYIFTLGFVKWNLTLI